MLLATVPLTRSQNDPGLEIGPAVDYLQLGSPGKGENTRNSRGPLQQGSEKGTEKRKRPLHFRKMDITYLGVQSSCL